MNGFLQVDISCSFAAAFLLYLFHKICVDKKEAVLLRCNLHTKQNLAAAPGPRSLSGPCGRTFPRGGAWPEPSPGRLPAPPERLFLSAVRGSGQCCAAAPGPGSGFALTLGRGPLYLPAVACPCPMPRVGQDQVYLLGGLAPSLCAPHGLCLPATLQVLPGCPSPSWPWGPPGPLGPQSSLDRGQRGRPGAREE